MPVPSVTHWIAPVGPKLTPLFADAKKNLTYIDLMTIEAEEIYASRVFKDGQVDLYEEELTEE